MERVKRRVFKGNQGDPIDENYYEEILFKTRDKKDKILQKLIFRLV